MIGFGELNCSPIRHTLLILRIENHFDDQFAEPKDPYTFEVGLYDGRVMILRYPTTEVVDTAFVMHLVAQSVSCELFYRCDDSIPSRPCCAVGISNQTRRLERLGEAINEILRQSGLDEWLRVERIYERWIPIHELENVGSS